MRPQEVQHNLSAPKKIHEAFPPFSIQNHTHPCLIPIFALPRAYQTKLFYTNTDVDCPPLEIEYKNLLCSCSCLVNVSNHNIDTIHSHGVVKPASIRRVTVPRQTEICCVILHLPRPRSSSGNRTYIGTTRLPRYPLFRPSRTKIFESIGTAATTACRTKTKTSPMAAASFKRQS